MSSDCAKPPHPTTAQHAGSYKSMEETTPGIKEISISFRPALPIIYEQPPWRERFFPTGFKKELRNLLMVAIPVIFTNMFQFIIPTESITLCGHLSKLEFDGVALANSMINAFGISIGTGLCTACDTLFAQAYGSANKKRTGMFLQRSIMIISLAPFLLWCIHLNAEPLFILLGQDPQVARLAATYMALFSPGFMFHFNYLILARYMQNQDRVYPPMIIGAMGNVYNIASQYITLYVLGMGYEASAVCQASAFFLMWFAEVSYIWATRLYDETWDGWTWEALLDWGHFLKLAIAGVGHVTLEEMGWEICVIMAGMIGSTELATQSLMLQAEVFTYMVPLGIGVALNIRVGQYLGANNPEGAKTSMNVGFCVTMVTSSVMAITFISCRNLIPQIFTNDPDIINMASSLLPVMVVMICADNISGACGGILRGCGKQKIGAFIMFAGYYLFGFPLAIVLAFVAKIDLLGILIGMSLGLIACTVGMAVVVVRMNWRKQASIAQQRMQGLCYSLIEEAKTETTPLLGSLKGAANPLLAGVIPGHVRAPSQPYTCSTEFPPLPVARSRLSRKEIIQLVKRRLLAALSVVVVFLGFLLLYLRLPREAYWPQAAPHPLHNGTVDLATVLFGSPSTQEVL